MDTHYQILGIPRNAAPQEIKNAYRALAAQFHPDKNPDKKAHERFSELSRSYAVLSNPEKRAAYDQELSRSLVSNPTSKAKELALDFFNAIQRRHPK